MITQGNILLAKATSAQFETSARPNIFAHITTDKSLGYSPDGVTKYFYDNRDAVKVLITSAISNTSNQSLNTSANVVFNSLSTNHIDFNTGATVDYQLGRLHWDDDDKTLDLDLDGGSVLQIGQETLIRGQNSEIDTITNGTVVYIGGAQGNRPKMYRADADAAGKTKVIAIATQDIPSSQTGFFTAFGLVRDINTNAWNEGDELFLSTSAGLMTNVKPTSISADIVSVGYVIRKSATVGSIMFTATREGITRSYADASYLRLDGSNDPISGGIIINAPLQANSISATTITVGNIDNTEFGYLNGTSANIQNQLTALSGSRLFATNGADNRVATFSNSNTLNGESGLTFDGTDLSISTTYSTRLNFNSISGANVGIRLLGDNTNKWFVGTYDNTHEFHVLDYATTNSDIFITSGANGLVRLGGATKKVNLPSLSTSAVVVTDGSKNLVSSTVSTTELGYLDGVTSSIQTQLANLSATDSTKVDKTTQVIAGTGLTGGGVLSANVTVSLPNTGVIGTYTKVSTDAQGRVSAATNITSADVPTLPATKIGTGIINDTEFNYLDGTTSNIQTQFDNIKLTTLSGYSFNAPSNETTGNQWLKLATGTMNDTWTWHNGMVSVEGGYQGRLAAILAWNIGSSSGVSLSASNPSPRLDVIASNGLDPTNFKLIISSDLPSSKSYEIWYNCPSAFTGLSFSFSNVRAATGSFIPNSSPSWTSAATTGTTYSASYSLYASTAKLANLSASTVVVSDASKNLISSNVTSTEIGYLSNTSANIQTQLTTLSASRLFATNGADNRIATFSNSNTLNGEANLTFDGYELTLSAVGANARFNLDTISNDSGIRLRLSGTNQWFVGTQSKNFSVLDYATSNPDILITSGASGLVTLGSTTKKVNLPSLSTSAVVVTDDSKNLVSSPITTTELNYLSTTSANIQTQLTTLSATKQNLLTNPVTGTGTNGYIPKFTGTSTIGNSIIQDSGTLVTIGGNLTATNISAATLTIGNISNTEFSYLDTVSANIQTQLTNLSAVDATKPTILFSIAANYDRTSTGNLTSGTIPGNTFSQTIPTKFEFLGSHGYNFTSGSSTISLTIAGTTLYTSTLIGSGSNKSNRLEIDAYVRHAGGSNFEITGMVKKYTNDGGTPSYSLEWIAGTFTATVGNPINFSWDTVITGTASANLAMAKVVKG